MNDAAKLIAPVPDYVWTIMVFVGISITISSSSPSFLSSSISITSSSRILIPHAIFKAKFSTSSLDPEIDKYSWLLFWSFSIKILLPIEYF